jgi:hypothetical protein
MPRVILSMLVGLWNLQAATPVAQQTYLERLREGARNGDAEAQFDLAKAYETGRSGLPQDLIQAQRWYRAAADQGEAFAEFSLGVLFNFGKGVKRDYVQAYAWYERAALHTTGGDRETIVEMRDGVAEKLTREQIAEAQRMAAEWKPAHKR